jgi:hypothetical protein
MIIVLKILVRTKRKGFFFTCHKSKLEANNAILVRPKKIDEQFSTCYRSKLEATNKQDNSSHVYQVPVPGYHQE